MRLYKSINNTSLPRQMTQKQMSPPEEELASSLPDWKMQVLICGNSGLLTFHSRNSTSPPIWKTTSLFPACSRLHSLLLSTITKVL